MKIKILVLSDLPECAIDLIYLSPRFLVKYRINFDMSSELVLKIL